MNIYLGPNYNFEKRAFFLNSNKIANKTKIKSYLIFLLNPQYSFILGKSFYSLSHIFIFGIIEDKINKTKWSYFQNLRKPKLENNEIPNSLRGSLSCLGFSRIKTKSKIKYDMHDDLMYNIPNWKFGMLHISKCSSRRVHHFISLHHFHLSSSLCPKCCWKSAIWVSCQICCSK